jgi:hypothetical protein
VYVPRYKSPTLVSRADPFAMLVWLSVLGYASVTGDLTNPWCGLLLAMTVLTSRVAEILEEHVLTRDRLDRLVARLANRRARRRAIQRNRGVAR